MVEMAPTSTFLVLKLHMPTKIRAVEIFEQKYMSNKWAESTWVLSFNKKN